MSRIQQALQVENSDKGGPISNTAVSHGAEYEKRPHGKKIRPENLNLPRFGHSYERNFSF